MPHSTKTTLRPLHDRVLVQRLDEPGDKHGHIVIPDTAKEKPQEGTVIAVGTGKISDEGKPMPLAVKQGDRILFGKYSGSEVTVGGQEYLIMKEEDVLGILGS
jgi:chaperonin GroES